MEAVTITRADIADAVSLDLGLSHAEALRIVTDAFSEMITALECGEIVKISSFGTFALHNKKERIGRNPKTKEEALIAARSVVTFKPSQALRAAVDA